MKGLVKLSGILFLTVSVLVGCSNSDKAQAKKVAEDLINEIFTVTSDKIDKYNELMKIEDTETFTETMQSNDRIIRSLMTEDAYTELVNSRQNLAYAQACSAGNYTMRVTDLVLSEVIYDDNKDKAGYNFEVKLKIISGKEESSQMTDEAKGYVGLIKDDGQWKVFSYKIFTFPKVLKEASNNN